MSWAKFDDRYDDNRKVRRAWKAHQGTVGLHAMAVTYCARHETDGLVDVDWLEDRVPVARVRRQILSALVTNGLFEVIDAEHYLVHDYLQYNDSHEVLRGRRRREADRKAALRAGGRGEGVRAESAGTNRRLPSDKPGCPDTPTRPDPTPRENSLRSSSPEPDESRPEVEALCQHLADRVIANGARRSQTVVTDVWRRECRLLLDRDGVAPDRVRLVIDWCQADEFWRANVLSMPKLREKFDQLAAKEQAGRPKARPARRMHPVTPEELKQLNERKTA